MRVRKSLGVFTAVLATSVSLLGAPALADEATTQPTVVEPSPPAPAPTPTPTPTEQDEQAPTDPVHTTEPSPSEASDPVETPADGAAGAQGFSTMAASGSIISPSHGQVFTGGDTVTFSVSASDDWYLELYCDDGFSQNVDNWDRSVSLPSVQEETGCQADLWVYDGYDGGHDYVDGVWFTVQPGLLANEIRNLTANRTTFYPRIRDGYKDSVEFALTVRASARVTMTVRNSEGRTVRRSVVQRPWDYDGYERMWATWNGKNGAGNPVPVGSYRVSFLSEGENLATRSARMTVKVATGYRTVRRTLSKDGWWGSVDETRGSCYASEDFYPHGNLLDCWGGRYAQATYNFRVPANATVIDWWARGERYCCDGRVIKSGVRVSSTRFRVRVRVTNWAAYTVRRAGIEYRYRKRA